MLEFATPFHATAGKLKSPTSATFDPAAWQGAYDQIKNPLPSDTNMLFAALWIASQSSALRDSRMDPDFDGLDAATTVMLAVATVNHQYLAVSACAEKSVRKARAEGALSFAHLTSLPLSDLSEQGLSMDQAVEVAVDSTESWLFDGYAKKDGGTRDDLDLAPIAMRAARRYSLQRGLNDLWNLCYWEGWRLSRLNGKLLCMPHDVPLATRLEATWIRQYQNFFRGVEWTAWAEMTPESRQAHALPRTVLQVASGRRRRIRIGKPTCRSRKPPVYFVECAGLEESYLKFFLDRIFPKEETLTCRRLVQAWHVILDLAEAMTVAPWRKDGSHKRVAENMALLIPRSELVGILSKALAVDESTADAAVSFLTFKVKTSADKGYRGLWSTPIVPVPNSNDVALVLPVLITSNALRKVEVWLEKASINDSLSRDARGNLYEADYRKRICEAILSNYNLKEGACASRPIKKDIEFAEQIDLLIRLGPLLIVGEVKCWLFPADSIERFYQLRKLGKAAEQAKRKAEAVRFHPSVAAKALGLSVDVCRQLRVIPLVVTNQGFGFSLDFGGCLVADAAFLEKYLGCGSLTTSLVVDTRTGEKMAAYTAMYERESEAAARLEKEISNPLVLGRYEQRISWVHVPFPAPTGETVFFVSPQLDDLSGDERALADMVGNGFYK